jgi:undecaprenyl-diphosphatase
MGWTAWFKSTDLGAHFFFQSKRQPWLDPFVKGLTVAGETAVAGLVAALAALGFMVAGRRLGALAVALSACLGLTVSESVKHIVKRERPPDVVNPVIEKPPSWSFPSGHALCAMAVYGAIGLTLAQLMPTRAARRLVIALGFLMGFVIGLTRLYLGVHFLFDVVGGWIAGVACALFGHWVHLSFAAAVASPSLHGAESRAVLLSDAIKATDAGPADIHVKQPDHYRPS